MPPKRPEPDTGVAAAVESCQSNTKMKRMVMFGLRALSELCTPPRGRYKENSLDAVARGIIVTLNTIANNMSSDEEIMELALKVCWGIAVALGDYKDEALMTRFKKENGQSLAANIINASFTDSQAVAMAFEMIESLANIDINVDIASIIPGLTNALGLEIIEPKTCQTIASTFETISAKKVGIDALASCGTVGMLVLFAGHNLVSCGPDGIDAACSALNAAGSIAKQTGGDITSVGATREMLDMYGDNRKIYDAGCVALAGMLTLEQLSSALESLRTAEEGSTERESALDLLSSMSYVPEFATAIVESGCISLLVEAVKSTANDISSGSASDSTLKGFTGSATLLGRISQSAANAGQVYEADGLTAVNLSLPIVNEYSGAFQAACLASAALAKADEAYALESYQSYSVSSTVLNALYNTQDKSIQQGSLDVINALASYDSLCPSLMSEFAFEIVAYSLQNNVDHAPTQLTGFSALQRLSPHVTSTATLIEYQGLTPICTSMSKHLENESLIQLAILMVYNLSAVPDASSNCADGSLVDVVLYAMLQHSSNTVITAHGTEALENLATDADAERHIQNLTGAMANCTKNVEDAFKALAAVAGLCKVARLSMKFDQASCPKMIISQIKKITDSQTKEGQVLVAFNGQRIPLNEKLMRAAFSTIETLALFGSAPFDTILPDALKSLQTNKAITAAVGCLKLYSDTRPVTEIILAIIGNLTSSEGGGALLYEGGETKAILDSVKSLPYSVKAQTHGMKILLNVVSQSDESIKLLQQAGTVSLVQTAMRTHHDPALRSFTSGLLSYLVPVDQLRELALRNIKLFQEALKKRDYKNALIAMRTLNDVAGSPEGCRILIHHRLVPALLPLSDVEGSTPELLEISKEAGQLVNCLAGYRSGIAAFNNSYTPQLLLKLIKDFSDAGLREDLDRALQTTAQIFKTSPVVAHAAPKEYTINLMSEIIQYYANSPSTVLGASMIVGLLTKHADRPKEITEFAEYEVIVQTVITQVNVMPNKEAKLKYLQAIEKIMVSEAAEVTQVFSANNLVPMITEILAQNEDDVEIVKVCCQISDHIGNSNDQVLKKHIQSLPAEKKDAIYRSYNRCLNAHLNDVEACCYLIRSLARFQTMGDDNMLKGAGIFTSLKNVLGVHLDSEEVGDSCADLLRAVGSSHQIPQLVSQAIAAQAAGDVNTLNDALENLNLFLLVAVDNPDEALQEEERLWEALARQLPSAKNSGDAKTMRNLLVTASRLVTQAKNDPDSFHGSWYCSQHFLASAAELMQSDHVTIQGKRSYIALAQMLTQMALNPNTRDMVVQSIPVQVIHDHLAKDFNDIDLCAASVALLQAISADEAGCENVRRLPIIPLLNDIMKTHRGRVKIIAPAMGLAQNIAALRESGTGEEFSKGEIISSALRATGTSPEAQGYLDADMMNMMAACVANPAVIDAVKNAGVLTTCIRRLEGSVPERSSRDISAADMSADAIMTRNSLALMKLMTAFAENGDGAHVRQSGGFKRIMDTLDENPDPASALHIAALNALIACCSSDISGFSPEFIDLLEKAFQADADGTLDVTDSSEAGKGISRLLFFDHPNNPEANLNNIRALISLFESLADLPLIEKFKTYIVQKLNSCRAVAAEVEDHDLESRINNFVTRLTSLDAEAPEMELAGADMAIPDYSNFVYDVDPEDPDSLTLKQVYEWLSERLEQGQDIDITSTTDPLIYQRFEFVYTKLTNYEALMLEYEDFAGYQNQFGCKSLTIWTKYTPDVIYTVLEWELPQLLFQFLNHQSHKVANSKDKAVILGTPVSESLAAFASIRDPGAFQLSQLENVQDSCRNNIEMCVSNPATKTDEHIIPRCELIEQIAINRTIFTDPGVVKALLKAWDLYDQHYYTSLALRHVFRALRRIVCESHIEFLIQENVSSRLIEELKKDFDNPLLIDGFFLLGVLAVEPRLKNAIGKLGGVQESLIILANHIDDPPGEGVVTNCQLALANLVVGHRTNCDQFYRHNGLSLNVSVLRNRGEHFDETNAAAALLTNACFRREDIKASYGQPQIGAPEALAHAISCYDGGTDPVALRCIESLFKAVSNMALYTLNIDLFLESGLENAYRNFLSCSDNLPDHIVTTGMFTLCNLTWENKEENMMRFGIITQPLLNMLAQPQRQEPALFIHSYETLAALLRLSENAQIFCENDGVASVINTIGTKGHESLRIVLAGLTCLSTLARNRDYTVYAATPEVADVCKSVLEGQFYSTDDSEYLQNDTALAALRLLKRCIARAGSPFLEMFYSMNGPATIVWYFSSLAELEDPLLGLATELARVCIGSLAISQGDDIDQYQNAISKMDAIEPIKKKRFFGSSKREEAPVEYEPLEEPEDSPPHEYAGYDSASMATMLSNMLTICQVESFSSSIRFTRCALTFVAYVTSYNVWECVEILFQYHDEFAAYLRTLYDNVGTNYDIVFLLFSIFGCLGYHHPDLFVETFYKDSSVYKVVNDFFTKLRPKDNDKIEKERFRRVKDQYEDFLLQYKLVLDGAGSDPMRKYAQYWTDFAWSTWDKDPYPNGVHDLTIKDNLRTGGRFKIVTSEKVRESFFWRGNQTLSLLQWRIEKEKKVENEGKPIIEYPYSIPVAKLYGVTRGLGSDLMKRASRKQRGLTKDLCFCIQGPPTEDYPDGVNLGIKCKSKAERDQFLDWIIEWREALTI